MTAYRMREPGRKTDVISVEPSPGRQWQEEWRPGDPRGGVAIHSVGLLCLEKERGPASLSLVRSAEQSRQLSAEFPSQPLRPGVLQNRLHLPPVSWGGTSRACTDTSGPQTGACTDTTGPAAGGGTFGYHRAGTRHGQSRKVLGSPILGRVTLLRPVQAAIGGKGVGREINQLRGRGEKILELTPHTHFRIVTRTVGSLCMQSTQLPVV